MTVAPKKALGQHFLVDENIVGVIGRLSALEPNDVVLEVGPGLGVLTRYLADHVRLVHAIEVAALSPAPTKLVANLPYNIATPLVVETLEHAASLDRWCVMVQREVADRFFATPRTKSYGAVSVLVQLAARKVGFHPVPPTVFRPRPRVDSALVAFERAPVASIAEVRLIVEAAFAHRRKTLANSVDLAGLVERARAEDALASIGRSNRVRAEELEPTEFVRLAELLR